jgi:hypothetical protein
LDLQSPDVLSRLVGVKTTEGTGLLIDPADPKMSVLYTKLTSVPPFGSRMPLASTPLTDTMLACVLAWVSDGALLDDASIPESAPTSDAPVETGVPESGQVEAGHPDGATQEGGKPDAGVREAGPTDAGSRG